MQITYFLYTTNLRVNLELITDLKFLVNPNKKTHP
jgi:hypothetical protein